MLHTDFDYQSLNKTITFTSGSGVGSMETFDVFIINDIIVEELLEIFTLRLTTPTGAPVAVTGLEVATAFIQEDLTDSKLSTQCVCICILPRSNKWF